MSKKWNLCLHEDRLKIQIKAKNPEQNYIIYKSCSFDFTETKKMRKVFRLFKCEAVNLWLYLALQFLKIKRDIYRKRWPGISSIRHLYTKNSHNVWVLYTVYLISSKKFFYNICRFIYQNVQNTILRFFSMLVSLTFLTKIIREKL